MKNFAIFSSLILLLFACQADKKGGYLVAEGKTMGTYYKVTYADSAGTDFSKQIDSLLLAVNHEISTYEPNSTISQFNRADSLFDTGLDLAAYDRCVADPKACNNLTNRHFYANFLAARMAHERTQGAFDPTVQPLVNYWGFGNKGHDAVSRIDSQMVDSLRQYVGFQKIIMFGAGGKARFLKTSPGVQLDFGGTGQGYGIDVAGEFLELHGIKNYLVDIGGECRARGVNQHGKPWTIGINTPKQEAATTDVTRVVQLSDLSVSTSGNYRNVREVNGQKYSHFINPQTGFPEKSNLLSVSVFSKDCLTADALATGFMVMGLDKAYFFVTKMEGIEALFIYSNNLGELQVKYTPGAEKFLLNREAN
jgi:thiamine biosynthesis lipoprotein